MDGSPFGGNTTAPREQHASHVHMLIRGPLLASTMSDYLVQRIHASKAITLHPCSEVVRLEGEPHLSHVTWGLRDTGEDRHLAAEHLFVMIGGDSCTKWLTDCVELDSNGFVRTFSASDHYGPFEKSMRGIFAGG